MIHDAASPDADDPAGKDRWGAGLALPIGLGSNTFGRTTDAAASRQVLDAFADAGGLLVDTADTYSDGAAETILGDWLRRRGNRDQVVVVTKVGNHPRFEGLSARTVTAGLEESLRRLGTDYVDLYLAHYEDDETALEDSVAAFDGLVRAGKVRAVGLSNFAVGTVRRWIDIADAGGFTAPVALQPHYSLVHRQPFEDELAPVAASDGLAVLPYRALGGGFLSGKYRSAASTAGRARGAGVLPLLTSAGVKLLDVLDVVAYSRGVRPAAVALAWLLRQPTVTAPLVSATSPAQLAELLAAPAVSLDDAEVARITAAADQMGR